MEYPEKKMNENTIFSISTTASVVYVCVSAGGVMRITPAHELKSSIK